MIWYEKLDTLLNFTSIVPLEEMTMDDKLNAIMRLALYLSIILAIVRTNFNFLFIAIIVALMTIIVHYYDQNTKKKQEEYLTKEGLDIVDRTVCARSTTDNPFMNVLVSDYSNGKERPPACNVLDRKVQKRIEDNFNAKLYRDVSDIYSHMSSQREFYTMPNTTIPNDAIGFAEFCYGTGPTCKEGNGEQCWSLTNRPLGSGSLYKLS